MQQGAPSNGSAQPKRQLPTVNLPGGVQPGVQYMPCIVPMEQWQSMQGSGAVPIAQVQASQLASGQLPLNSLLGGMTGGAGGQMMGGPGGPGDSQPWNGNPQMNSGSRPGRGRSPPARGRQRASSPTSRPGQEPQNLAAMLGKNAKDAWRPSFIDPEQAERRRESVERKSKSPDRRQSQERRASAERRTSGERRVSGERTGERRHSLTRRNSKGPQLDRSELFQNQGYQSSDRWQQSLPLGGSAQVFLIADTNTLAQAASRLNFIEQGAIIAMDCQGWNLRAAAGVLCMLTVAFSDPSGLQVFMFDVLQLGENLWSLTPFFTNPHASKITADATTHATVLAQKFGINLAGVIDAQWAYEELNNKSLLHSYEVLDWCGLAPQFFQNEAIKLTKTPELWGQRPMARSVLSHAAQSISLLHSSSAIIWRRLAYKFGPQVFNMVANASRHRAEMAAAAGWACRNAGLYTAEQDYKKGKATAPAARDDEDLDDWLAKRFGKPDEKPSVALRAKSVDRQPVPDTAIRQGDSPRTAAWRAKVADMNPVKMEPSRQRSASPTLESWLSRRGSVKERPSRRASSLPSSREHPRQSREDKEREEFIAGPLRPLVFDQIDHKRWTEIVEEEQAKAGEEDGDDDLFEDLKQATDLAGGAAPLR